MKRKIAKIVMIVNLILILIVGPVCAASGAEDALAVILILGIPIIVVCCHFLRCPSCGTHLGRSSLWAQYCPRCGEPLDD